MPQSMVAYLGLGANLGDPIEQLVKARSIIAQWPETLALESSFFYVSSPVGYADQNDFLNCVLKIHTTASAEELLALTQQLELELGRLRDPNNQNAPRMIDIDILLYADMTIDLVNLTIPHPRLEQRLFVLLPLLELVEDDRSHYQELVNQLLQDGDQSIYCLRAGDSV